VEAALDEVRQHGAEHPPGDDDDVHAGGARRCDRRLRARAEDGVLGDERPVEVDRECRERVRKAGRKVYGVPPVDFTT
jgi:hypothetical protein